MDDGEWLSYSELAERRGIDRDSASRLAIRRRWRRRKGNDGLARVLVPAAYLNPAEGDSPPDNQPDSPPDVSPRHIAALEAAIAALESAQKTTLEALELERSRAGAAEARAERAEQRVEQVEARAADREAAAQARAEQDRAAAAEHAAWLRSQVEALTARPPTWRDLGRWIRSRIRPE